MIYEDEIEQLDIDLLKEIGYEYYHGQEIAPDSQNPKRRSIEEVVHEEGPKKCTHKVKPKNTIKPYRRSYKNYKASKQPKPNREQRTISQDACRRR